MTDRAASGPLDILTDLSPKRRANNTCDISQLRALRPDLAEQYDRAQAAGRYSDLAIARWVTDHGFPIGRITVQRHRLNECMKCRTS